MSIVRRPVQLISAGLNEASADLGGMAPGESLILKNAYFDTPSTASVRAGSVDGDIMQDDGVPDPITSIPFFKYFPSQGTIFVVGHSTITSKHYVFELNTLGENLLGVGSPVDPKIIPTSGTFTYDVALPARISGAAWYGRKFYFCDVAGVKGMCRYNGDTGVVDYPLYTLGSGPAAPLRPRKLFNHKNHIISLGYGDENTPYAPDVLRSSVIGDPDTWEAVDIFPVGNTEEPLIDGLSVGDFAILFKDSKVFRMSGDSAVNWGFTPIDPDRGGVAERCATYYDGYVWFISPEGFSRIGNGPSELFVDKVKLSFASFDNFENCWVDVNVPERMVVFACHEVGDAGSYPTLLVQVDTRTGNFVVRKYLTAGPVSYESFHGARVPAVGPVEASQGPTAGPTIQPATLIGDDGWTCNWIMGDARPEVTTRFEVRNQDTGSGFLQEASIPTPGVFYTHLGKLPGTIYEERVRHERNGIFSIFDPETDGQEVLTLPNDPTIYLNGASAGGIQLNIYNPNSPGFGQIVIESDFGPHDLPCPIVAPTWSTFRTLINPLAGTWVNIGSIVCSVAYAFRCKWSRTGFPDSGYSNTLCVVPCSGGV